MTKRAAPATASVARTIATGTPQPGRRAIRVVTAVPHSRHQSCSGASGASQRATAPGRRALRRGRAHPLAAAAAAGEATTGAGTVGGPDGGDLAGVGIDLGRIGVGRARRSRRPQDSGSGHLTTGWSSSAPGPTPLGAGASVGLGSSGFLTTVTLDVGLGRAGSSAGGASSSVAASSSAWASSSAAGRRPVPPGPRRPRTSAGARLGGGLQLDAAVRAVARAYWRGTRRSSRRCRRPRAGGSPGRARPRRAAPPGSGSPCPWRSAHRAWPGRARRAARRSGRGRRRTRRRRGAGARAPGAGSGDGVGLGLARGRGGAAAVASPAPWREYRRGSGAIP